MVQVDVFWSYGIGAGFAYSAERQLRERPPTKENGGYLANPYFSRTVLYLATLFAPSGLYLLWQFTNWETMQAGDKDMPAWLVTTFAITNVTQGMLGFGVTYKLVAAGKRYLAFLQPLLGYFAMFFILVHGWDGTGYKRFFSQNRDEYLRFTPDQIGRWFVSPVAITLGVMGCVMIPVMVGWMVRFMAEGHRAELGEAGARARRRAYSGVQLAAILLSLVFGLVLGSAIVASVLVHQLGWALGLLAFAMAGGFGIVGPTGVLHWAWKRIDPLAALGGAEATSPSQAGTVAALK